jgi:hypothetical protein
MLSRLSFVVFALSGAMASVAAAQTKIVSWVALCGPGLNRLEASCRQV